MKKSIDDLLRDHLIVLSSSKTSEDGQYSYIQSVVLKMEFYPEYFSFLLDTAVQREHDVQESILFMAKQSGNVDPDVSQSMNIIKIHC